MTDSVIKNTITKFHSVEAIAVLLLKVYGPVCINSTDSSFFYVTISKLERLV